MTKSVVDLDDIDTWPEPIRRALDQHIRELVREREKERQFERSGGKWTKPWPPKPKTAHVTAVIEEHMKGRELRVFHATRLLNYDEVRTNGLRLLSYAERVARLREMVSGPLAGLNLNLDQIIAKAKLDSPFFGHREGMVWATPLRRYLHDGGCDVFFESWGGEAVERIATTASPTLARAIQKIGTPGVVVFRIPGFGFCEFGDLRLAPTMIDLGLERDATIDVSVGGWDVCCKSAVPAEWIEAVLPPNDPSLAHNQPNKTDSP